LMEKQKLTGSSLPVWPQSRVFVGLNTHFPLLSFTPVSPKNEEDTIHELLHQNSSNTHFTSQ
jgi:hypothetical protein